MGTLVCITPAVFRPSFALVYYFIVLLIDQLRLCSHPLFGLLLFCSELGLWIGNFRALLHTHLFLDYGEWANAGHGKVNNLLLFGRDRGSTPRGLLPAGGALIVESHRVCVDGTISHSLAASERDFRYRWYLTHCLLVTLSIIYRETPAFESVIVSCRRTI